MTGPKEVVEGVMAAEEDEDEELEFIDPVALSKAKLAEAAASKD